MKPRSLILAVAGAFSAVIASMHAGSASELKVMTSVALTSVLDDLGPQFERTGNKLTINYGLAAEMRKRILEGETADVVILTRSMMDDLQKQNRLAAGGLIDVAGTPVAVAARSGAPKPDISSVEAFKQTLLKAKSVVYADPAKGGLSGVVAARAIERMGIADQMKGKTILVPGAQAADVVARGEADIGIAQASEIVPVSGAQLVGPLPGEFATMTLFTGAVGAGSRSPDAAKAFIDFLKSPDAAARFRSKGFEPG